MLDADSMLKAPWPPWLLPFIDRWGGRGFWYALLWFVAGLGCSGPDKPSLAVWGWRAFITLVLLLMFLGGVVRKRRAS